MDFGLYFPIREMYALMGFPTDDTERYKKYAAWTLAMVGGNQVDPEKIDEARRNAGIAVKLLYDAIQEVVVKRRAEGAPTATTSSGACCAPNTRARGSTTIRSSPLCARCCRRLARRPRARSVPS